MRRVPTAGAAACAALLLAGCASSGALEETEQVLVAEMHELQEGQDSLRAEMVRVRRALVDSLEARRGRALTGQGELGRRLDRLEEELGRIAALLGQTQRQITRLSEQVAAEGVTGGGSAAGTGAGGAGAGGRGAAGDTAAVADSAADVDEGAGASGGGEDPQALYEASLQQFRRGAYGTARSGLQEFLSLFPDHELAPDAQYYVAECWAEAGEPEDALEAYGRVVELFPDSRRAASALYKSGRIELERGNTEDARVFFSRVVQGYPDSPEASLARDRLQSLEGGGG